MTSGHISVVHLFPGQGSQSVGMGRNLYAAYPAARAVFDQADRILEMPLSRLCFDGPADRLNDTVNTQPALLTVSIAALRVLKAENKVTAPDCVIGHSMGEFSALVAAGALSFEDGLRLVRERGRLMKQAGDSNPGGMAAVLGMTREALEEICATAREAVGEYVGIANDNCPGQVVISGTAQALQRAMDLAAEAGAKRVVRLAVSIAAHSPLMAEAADKFRQILAATRFASPQVPLIANATARPVMHPDDIRDVLGRQFTSSVWWTDSIRWLVEQGMRRCVEIGPGNVLVGLVKRIERTVERQTTDELLSGPWQIYSGRR